MTPGNDAVIDALLAREGEIVERLNALLRIPTVGADPACAGAMQQARALLVSRLESFGLENVQLLDGGGEPAVYGEWLHAPGQPTYMIYGHYDVQPADPIDAWTSPPFEPTVRDGCLFARGASDVKGSTTIAIETVGQFLATEGACPVNIKIFLEGEEETGSPSLRAIVAKYRDLLRSDGVLSADGGRASRTVATVNTGARGNAKLEFSLCTASTDLHSGRYGGAVRNALHEMARLVATLHDDAGNVAVRDFDIDALPLTGRQREDTAAFPFDENAFFEDVGASPAGETGYTTRERITLRPALDVNGMWGGYTGSGSKTVIPAKAHAKLSVRVVAGQDPDRVIGAVRQHLEHHCPSGVTLTIDHIGGASPASTLAADSPMVAAAERVLLTQMGQRAIHVRLGASVPITAIFQEMLGIGTLMFGYNLPDEPVHAPDEFFRMESIGLGLKGWTLLLRELRGTAPR
ncbi:dipeptidase [Chitinasiproducens palmae]|uniref:Acetylornithine deacetylase/Succinyl-diaminopimelate desuccinylase n=1 Tax=Chitinasiproducens palmae TaxID=1770053 RepID=A0A1H2PPU8_9BURK|nr:dipeptidase [Chitinasiproducens palmae]SDV48807.1 Acetylornithine deacetylase/Succinyl-diaminopimelate desuccinylase [Chitinasiproducens palmae]